MVLDAMRSMLDEAVTPREIRINPNLVKEKKIEWVAGLKVRKDPAVGLTELWVVGWDDNDLYPIVSIIRQAGGADPIDEEVRN